MWLGDGDTCPRGFGIAELCGWAQGYAVHYPKGDISMCNYWVTGRATMAITDHMANTLIAGEL
jgi:hypothetical protein